MEVSYIVLSIPIFFLLIGVELLYGHLKKRKLYRFNDTITNINLGTGQQIVGLMMKGVFFLGYMFLYENYRFLTIEDTAFNWFLLFLGVDFFYYWFHRKSHEVNAIWAAHIVHHQSEEYNLSVALRQSWIQGWFSWVFYLPLAVMGFDPILFLAMNSLTTLYQFWIHTTAIKTLGPLEWVMNTPSHHRVHHGSDPKYIDKNHAATLIIWDRLFGTFKKEEEEPTYGITTALNSWSPIWANVHYWKELWELSKQSKGFDKLLVYLKPPGWRPDYLGGFQAPPEIDKSAYRKFDHDGMKHQHVYIFFVFLVSMALSTTVLFGKSSISTIPLYAALGYVLLTLTMCGGLLENKPWIIPAEYARIFSGLVIALLFWEHPQFETIMQTVSILTVINFFWFSRVVKQIKTDVNAKFA